MLPLAYMKTPVTPAGKVAMSSVGVVSLVMPSPTVPVSLAALSVGSAGWAGAMVSMVTGSSGLWAPIRPLASS